MNVVQYSVPEHLRTLEARPRLFGFIVHLVAYSAAMAGIIVVNMIVAPTHPWFVLIMFGWLGYLILHLRAVCRPDA